ncbi:hypothetical protein [Neorhodopirellula lusitana]|uniref:hypothetical protein n=1 Tax=Neorhodopirellula lusitana TaxID=445327 RepID=UPI0024B87730|nr:hypothetical protein [Neorhodopirellula lusitana]
MNCSHVYQGVRLPDKAIGPKTRQTACRHRWTVRWNGFWRLIDPRERQSTSPDGRDAACLRSWRSANDTAEIEPGGQLKAERSTNRPRHIGCGTRALNC